MTDPSQQLSAFVQSHARIAVLTGAGLSTSSGIPDYRDRAGEWKRPPPVQFRDFLSRVETRQRYWARSLVGWRHFQQAHPNAGHRALAKLEQAGYVQQIVTQNVDRLHQRAGTRQVIDLHGRLDRVVCVDCGIETPRAPIQDQLVAQNPLFTDLSAEQAPDGDADLDAIDFSSFRVPTCPACGGIVKPDVVFYGEGVPSERVDAAMAGVLAADALLVCGSSLMVYSGYRFCLAAADAGLPIAAVNLGRTRADNLLQLKIEARCEDALAALSKAMTANRGTTAG